MNHEEEHNFLGTRKKNARLSYFSARSQLTSTKRAQHFSECVTFELTHLVGLHNDEDVVHAHGQHEEGNDLNDDEREGDADVAEDTQRTRH